jgi:hypothetical protein
MAPDRQPDPVAVALAVARVFDQLGIRYVVGGSLASALHGEPRSTLDVDFVADVRPEHMEALVAALAPGFYVSDTAMRDALHAGGSFNAIHLVTAVKVDVFPVGDDAFDAERIARRRRAVVWADPPAELYVDAAEYTVLRKLEWYRRGGEVSERQWRDVVGVLRVRKGSLDAALLDRWARRLGVADLLGRARATAGE